MLTADCLTVLTMDKSMNLVLINVSPLRHSDLIYGGFNCTSVTEKPHSVKFELNAKYKVRKFYRSFQAPSFPPPLPHFKELQLSVATLRYASYQWHVFLSSPGLTRVRGVQWLVQSHLDGIKRSRGPLLTDSLSLCSLFPPISLRI